MIDSVQLVQLIVASVLVILCFLFMLKGKPYEYMLEPLDFDEFPLKSLYTIGLGALDLFKALPDLAGVDRLRDNVKLLYDQKYMEYYTRIILAQAISLFLAPVTLFVVLGGLVGGEFGLFLAIIGVVVGAVFAVYFYTNSVRKVKTRQEECEASFPDALSKMALLVNSGVILHDAWQIVAKGNEGALYDLMRNACDEMDNGASDAVAIHNFGVHTNSDDIRKFTTALLQSIERGGGDLPIFLMNESNELWNLKKQKTLQKGEKAASSLLVPITLMFAGVLLIVLASVIQSLSL